MELLKSRSTSEIYIKRVCSILPEWPAECHALFSETRNVAIVIACNRIDTPAASMRRPAFGRTATYGVVDPRFACYGAVDSPSLGCDAVDGVAIMIPARKNVSAADNRQKGQKACSMNAWT